MLNKTKFLKFSFLVMFIQREKGKKTYRNNKREKERVRMRERLMSLSVKLRKRGRGK